MRLASEYPVRIDPSINGSRLSVYYSRLHNSIEDGSIKPPFQC
jgi:hypothetical protein